MLDPDWLNSKNSLLSLNRFSFFSCRFEFSSDPFLTLFSPLSLGLQARKILIGECGSPKKQMDLAKTFGSQLGERQFTMVTILNPKTL
jgi:hypothetical protein